MINATFKSGDLLKRVTTDITSYIEQASPDNLVSLYLDGFQGKRIFKRLTNFYTQPNRLDEELSELSFYVTSRSLSYYCQINQHHIMDWLERNRPFVYLVISNAIKLERIENERR